MVVCGLLWGGGYAFSRYLRDSDHYRVKHIRVDGADVLTPDEIIQASQLTTADRILFLNPHEIAERVEALPRIKRSTVTRVFPDFVLLSVIERTAVATLVVNNRTFEIDTSGVVLEEIISSEAYTGPLITLEPPLTTITPGERVNRELLFEALEVWTAYAQRNMAHEVTVSELAAYGDTDIRMYCEGMPFEIRWGRGDYDVQARRLDILWKELDGEPPCTEYLDLRFGRDLACK
jgi:cell division protein FtsQ